jgi:hypothetical protein
MVLSVQSRNKMPKHAISVTETKKGTRVTSPSEDNSHFFFYHKGTVHFEFLEQGRKVKSIVIWKYWQVTRGRSSEKT